MAEKKSTRIVRTYFRHCVRPDNKKFEPSITVPDLSFNLKELLENFSRGLLDIDVLKAQHRDELELATGCYDLSEISAAMKTSISNYERAISDKQRIEAALLAMQQPQQQQQQQQQTE